MIEKPDTTTDQSALEKTRELDGFFEKRLSTSEGKTYIRTEVASDGDCGYTAFGIIRSQAYDLILQNIYNVQHLIRPAVHEALLTKAFLDYLISRSSVSSDTTLEQIEANLDRYVANLLVL